jgi:tetratricopeptide (TPR) repeat protein
MGCGRMPNLESLIERGVIADLPPMAPLLDSSLWTSVITGQTADRHGVLSDFEEDHVTGLLRPVGTSTRRSQALWNMVESSGGRSMVVNWPGTHPAESLAGVQVSDAFSRHQGVAGWEWPMSTGAVQPPSLSGTISNQRVSVLSDIWGSELRYFIPELERVHQATDKRPLELARLLAEDFSTHAVATDLLRENPGWEFAAIHYRGIGAAMRTFGCYKDSAPDGMSERNHEIYGSVVERIYWLQDQMLKTLMELAAPDTTFILCSVPGTHVPPMAGTLPRPNSGNVCREGFLVMSGPGIRADERLYGARLLDITPTALHCLGLPVGADMPGRVILDGFKYHAEPRVVATWAPDADPTVNGRSLSTQELEANEALLESLGCTRLGNTEAARAAQFLKRQRLTSLFQVDWEMGRLEAVIESLRQLVALEPHNRCHQLFLAQACLEAGRLDECDAALASGYDARLAAAEGIVRSGLHSAKGDRVASLKSLVVAEAQDAVTPEVNLAIGYSHLASARHDEASRIFQSIIDRDPFNAAARAGLARAILPSAPAAAALQASVSVGLKFGEPDCHYILGAALSRIGAVAEARSALATAVSIKPDMTEARHLLDLLEETGL